jgi:hypothetical protein
MTGPTIARLQTASAYGAAWKRWDGSVQIRKRHGEGVGVVGKDPWDMDGAGIEGLVLLRWGGGRRGSWGRIAAFVLTGAARASGRILREIN